MRPYKHRIGPLSDIRLVSLQERKRQKHTEKTAMVEIKAGTGVILP